MFQPPCPSGLPIGDAWIPAPDAAPPDVPGTPAPDLAPDQAPDLAPAPCLPGQCLRVFLTSSPVAVAGAGGVGTADAVVPADALFALIGAQPHTGWLPSAIARDAALARLPRVLVAPRGGVRPAGVELLALPDHPAAVIEQEVVGVGRSGGAIPHDRAIGRLPPQDIATVWRGYTGSKESLGQIAPGGVLCLAEQ